MAPIQITVRITDDGKPGGLKSLRGLQGFEKRNLLRMMGQKFKEITLGTFGAGGSNRPAPWSPLSKKYQKRIGYFGPPKLVLSGDMRGSIYVRADNDQYVEVGTDVPYSATHQFGRGAIPARPFFPILFQGTDYRLTPYAQQQLEDTVQLTLIKMMT